MKNVSKKTGEKIRKNLGVRLNAIQKVGNKLERDTKEPDVEFI